VVQPYRSLNQALAAGFSFGILNAAPQIFPDFVGFIEFAAIKEVKALLEEVCHMHKSN
jgi:hypothetical protein